MGPRLQHHLKDAGLTALVADGGRWLKGIVARPRPTAAPQTRERTSNP